MGNWYQIDKYKTMHHMLYYASSDQICKEIWYPDYEVCASVFYTKCWEPFNILHIWKSTKLTGILGLMKVFW